MLALFYQYLIRHHKVVLPGLGAVVVQRNPASSHFVDHHLNPPVYSFQWLPTSVSPTDNFFVWMASKLDIAEEEAVIRVNQYVADLRREINAGKEINWDGVGIIRRGLDSGIELDPVTRELAFEKSLQAEKVIHAEDHLTLTVGDKQKTSLEMAALLVHPLRQKGRRFRIALIASILLLVFVLTYCWKYGFNANSIANQKKIAPQDPPASYQPLK